MDIVRPFVGLHGLQIGHVVRKMGYLSAIPMPPRISRPRRAHSLSNHMYRHFEFEFLPDLFGGINGSFQGERKGQAGAVPKRETQGSRLGGKGASEACLG